MDNKTQPTVMHRTAGYFCGCHGKKRTTRLSKHEFTGQVYVFVTVTKKTMTKLVGAGEITEFISVAVTEKNEIPRLSNHQYTQDSSIFL